MLRPCCRAHVVRLSQIAAETFESEGIPFWADYGTLLGAARNPMTTRADYPWLSQDDLPDGPIAPGIIPHDKDADWGLPMEHFRPVYRALRKRIKRLGMNLIVREARGSMKLRVSLFNHTNLDLFFWSTRDDGSLYRKAYIGVDDFKGRDIPPGLLYPLTSVQWEGMTLPAPRDPEAFLAFRYGPNWKTPVNANHDGVKR